MKKLLILTLALLMLAGCAAQHGKTEYSEADVFAMDTFMELRAYSDESVLQGAVELIKSIESRLSVTDENSEIFKLNSGQNDSVSHETAELLKTALSICASTNGALDVTIYPVVRAWGFTTGSYRVPGADELRELLGLVDHSKVGINGDSVVLPHGMMIDLGSIAKGYTGDEVAAYLKENGVSSALLNLGGNIHAVGSKPDGSAWKIAIRDPLGGGLLGSVSVTDKAVVTSGGYERYFEQDGKKYWHIIDPSTGMPADSGLLSVTVIGENGALCDGLSTALFVMGLDGSAEYWKTHTGFEAVFLTSGGRIYVTEGLVGNFTPLGDHASEKASVIYR